MTLHAARAQRIGDLAAGRDNNFNLLRSVAAASVLISHAYPVSLGPDAAQPLSDILQGTTLGALGVMVFFSISGFFITRSFARRTSLAAFLRARCLRLFPALIVVLAVTVLVAGFWLTTAAASVFWAAVPGYFLRNVTLFFLTYDLPGVFENNPYGAAINGSLWTLNYEIMCYIGVVLCGLAGAFARPAYFAVVVLGFAILYVINAKVPLHPRIDTLMMLGLPFVIGMSFWVWRRFIPLSGLAATALVAITFIGHETLIFRPLLVLAVSYTVFIIGYAKIPGLGAYNRLGDYSYGIYVYAFPIQQLLASFGVLTPEENIAFSLPLTLLCAMLSWHLVEAPAMRLKSSTSQARKEDNN